MNATDVEIAWAAGLFEGEGCISASVRKEDEWVRFVAVSLTMVDEDVVLKFARIVGYGSVIKYPGAQEGRKERYVWQTNKASEVRRIFMMFAPHLGQRRLMRGIELLKAYDECREGAR